MSDLTVLTVNTIPALYEKRDTIFKDDVFDMQDLKKIDSAGIAFLVQWAKSKESQILQIKNMHSTAHALISMMCVSSLFKEI